MKYNIYRGKRIARALVPESALDKSQTERPIATVEAEAYRDWSPRASAFQSSNENDYIQTGLPWPDDVAVVVH